MIPTIGIMIAVYIVVRCIEIIGRAESQYGSKNARGAVVATALIGMFVTAICAVNLVMSSSGISSAFSLSPVTGSSTPARPETCKDPNEHRSASGMCFCDSGYHRDPTTLICVPD